MSRRKLLREPRFQYRSSNKATASTHLTFAVSNILQTKLVVRSMHGFRQGRTQGRAEILPAYIIALLASHLCCPPWDMPAWSKQAKLPSLHGDGWIYGPQPCSESCLRAMLCGTSLFYCCLSAHQKTRKLWQLSLCRVSRSRRRAIAFFP
jgi:hypothetical protein